MGRLRITIFALAALVGVLLPAAAGAGGAVQIRQVDLDEFPLVRVTALAPAGSTPTVSESGGAVREVRARELGASEALVLAVDNSQSMRGRPLQDAKRAAATFLRQATHSDSTTVVSFGHEAHALTSSETTKDAAVRAVGSLVPDERFGTALYDAIVLSTSTVDAPPDGTRVLVLLTDGHDRGSQASLEEAIEATRRAKVVVYPIAAGEADTEALSALASATGGRVFRTEDTAGLASAYAALGRELERTWQISYSSSAFRGDAIAVTVHAGDAEDSARARIPNGGSNDPLGIIPPGVARSPLTGAAVALLAALCLSLAAAVVIRRRRRAQFGRLLERYVAIRDAAAEAPPEQRSSLEAFLAWTEQSMDDLPGSKRLNQTFERAGSRIRRGYLPYLGALAGLVFGLAASVAGAPPPLSLLVMVSGLAVPFVVLRIAAHRRMKEFDRQLPDVLASIASALRAGHGLRTALKGIADDGAAPAADEFRRVLGEERLGRPLAEAIDAMCERLGSRDLEYVATAINVQAQTGGSLAGLFDTLAGTVRERQRHARKVKALTALGRSSAIILVLLPIGLGGLMTLIAPLYMTPLFTTSSGHAVIGICLTSMAIGGLILKRIVSVRY
jgi:tight adherence protein B